jgi:Tol biopolymer transport system component
MQVCTDDLLLSFGEDFRTPALNTAVKALLPQHRRLTVHTTSHRLARLAASFAMVLSIAACGGGGDEGPTEALANAPAPEAGKPRRTPPPPPPAPSSDTTLALVSASAAGQPARGDPCAVSADGSKVLFKSSADTLISGDSFLTDDIFLKDLNGNGVTRVVAAGGTTVRITCLTMTPDANTVLIEADAVYGVVDVLGNQGSERAIFAKNLTTGVQTRASPLLSTFPNVSSYKFAGVSDDGLRVAFIAQPTRTCLIFDCTATGPARMLIRNLATGVLTNLESRVRLSTQQGEVDGDVFLSPNGQTLAFATRQSYPEAGDNNATGDVLALDIASGRVRLVSSDAAGRQITAASAGGVAPSWGVQTFLANSSKIAIFGGDSSVGPGGIYVKDLTSGALTRVLGSNLTFTINNREQLSFSDDGRRVAYVESTGGGIDFNNIPRVLDLTTGLRLNAATLTNGTVSNGRVTTNVLISRDGRSVVFGNNGTNLLGAPPAGGGAEQRAYRKLVP